MRLATFAILAVAAIGFASAPAQGIPAQSHSTTIAYAVPGTEYRGLDPTSPERATDPSWNDTADTVENLDSLDTGRPDVHLETDLNNDPTDPLLEDHSVDPVDNLPADEKPDLYPPSPRDPLKEPLP